MSALSFTYQRGRIRRIVEAALNDTTFVESHSEDNGRMVAITASKNGDRRVVRFRAVRDSKSNQEPEPGVALRLRDVGSADGFSLLRLFFPFFRASGYAHVRIDAGQARLEITCQDAEWWQEDPAGT